MPVLKPSMETTVAGIHFNSPLLNASGAFNPHLFHELFPLKTALGGIVTKTVTAQPQSGNIQPRTVELPGIGMLNSIGLQNPGLAYTLEKDLPSLAPYELPVILSISAHSSADFAKMAEAVLTHAAGHTIAALELNLSCPNVEKGGVHFGSAADSVRSAVSAVKNVFSKPVFAKLTPNVTDIVAIGGAALEGGADGLTAINTLLGVAIDIRKRKPVLPRVSAGYSGPGIKPVALHAIWNLHKHFPETPIIGVGGISNANDALEFLMAGASMVQIGTACFRHPTVFVEIRQQLQDWCESEGIASLDELRGCAHHA
ncbi:MAG TPA: dihydroorotate dehydrogenase [Oculatellaceae cyanobacterium]|jgi:dihydroorotate dehydrogenase (NAD+) catalytic subunit